MKYFFGRQIPAASDVLLLESGAPEIARRAMEGIRKIFPGARYHLCTCWPGPPPAGFADVFRVTNYASAWQKLRFLLSLRRRRWEVFVILCTGESVLWRWKMLGMLLLPAKVLIVNENADFFWLDWGNRRILRLFLGIRWGGNLGESFRGALRALVFPLTFLLLVGTAGFLYTRRAWRLLRWKIHGLRLENPQRSSPAPLSQKPSEWERR